MTRRLVERPVPLLIAGAALLASSVLGGCGDSEGAAPVDCTVVEPGADGTTEVTVVGKNLAFDTSCIEVRPGRLVVTFENEDGGTAHNFHLTGHGLNLGTKLERGVTTQTLTVDLTELGRYTYACDPHGSMEGTLVVAEPAEAGVTTTQP